MTVLEARNRVGGRVITFRDFVPGKHVEGGGELVGSNHPTWVAYADRFKLTFLDVTEEEDFDFPMMLGGKRLDRGGGRSALGGDGRGRQPDERRRGQGGRRGPAVDAPNAEALDERTLASWIPTLNASPLQAGASTR